MLRKAAIILVEVVTAGLLVFGFAGNNAATFAQEPTQPSNAACLGCHADSNKEIILPSGEVIAVDVDLAVMAESAHGVHAARDVDCADCHANKVYQYPHAEILADTQRAYTEWVSQNCTDCHYPHSPLHPTDGALPALPSCADCHGSHDIKTAERVVETMPANCVRCHTDQEEEWATALIGPRAGFGEGAEGYIGSDRCGGCHETLYKNWQETLHANTIRDVSVAPEAIIGDFQHEYPQRTFDLKAVDYTLGRRWKQLYLTVDEETGAFDILPAKWIKETQEWVSYTLESEQEQWLQECSACHVTGLDTESWTFEEFGIGCEGCHGPGEAHAADPEHTDMFAAVDDQVCGSCHSRGVSPEGHPFPAGYEPGDDLNEHFSFVQGEEFFWPDGSARLNNMQYLDWHLTGNAMEASPDVNCITCHAVHDTGQGQGQLQTPLNDLCLNCHGDKEALTLHTPFHRAASERFDFACTDCHMPAMATNAVDFDTHNHTFHQPNLEASLAFGLENMPNACNLCHTDMSAEWAFDTVAYAAAVTTPAPASLFGPGPTPTSPPPPTPIRVAGQPPAESQVPSNTWLRYAFLSVVVLAVAGIAYAFILIVRSREPKNV